MIPKIGKHELKKIDTDDFYSKTLPVSLFDINICEIDRNTRFSLI